MNLRPHGNSKGKNVGFTRKKPSLVSKVSATATKSSVTSAVERNIADHGGRANISDELRVTKAALYRLNSSPTHNKMKILLRLWSEQQKTMMSVA